MEHAPRDVVWSMPEDEEEDDAVNEWNWALSDEEVLWCEQKARAYLAGVRGGSPRAGSPEQRQARHTLNWMGQLVAAKCLGIGMLDDPEIRGKGHLEHGIEVRTTAFAKPSLFLNDRDVHGRAFILVRMQGKMGQCMGWMRFDDSARQLGEFQLKPGNTGAPQQVWIFPVIKLNSMASMRARLDKLRQAHGL